MQTTKISASWSGMAMVLVLIMVKMCLRDTKQNGSKKEKDWRRSAKHRTDHLYTRAVQKVIRQNAMQSGTSTFVGILLYITGAPGAFFQNLEPGDQQRKFGSLNCKLARAIWAGILWHMLLYTRDMIGFNVWLDRLYRLYVQRWWLFSLACLFHT